MILEIIFRTFGSFHEVCCFLWLPSVASDQRWHRPMLKYFCPLLLYLLIFLQYWINYCSFSLYRWHRVILFLPGVWEKASIAFSLKSRNRIKGRIPFSELLGWPSMAFLRMIRRRRKPRSGQYGWLGSCCKNGYTTIEVEVKYHKDTSWGNSRDIHQKRQSSNILSKTLTANFKICA